ncbi:hypothetical protein Nepgr_001913 [Nepenthes gracilis]|uniref:Uncharacterized protein n=1 Tax=Nepenthes gracilis TaxID=150966 RepID=A0AAD3P5A5_NEPGR|nr:hypothetical protein Nepgr_001913 [Nepenthes gracilis]
MERGFSSSESASSSSSPISKSGTVLAIECIRGTAKADEWSGGLLQTGDIVEEIRVGDTVLRSPFKNGKSSVQKVLHSSFKNQQTSIVVRVRRGRNEFAELQACIVPIEAWGKKHQYVLRAIDDPNYAVRFFDRTEAECLELQASRSSRLHHALSIAQFQDGYESYPWERKMQETLSIPGSSCFLSILFLPKASDRLASGYNDVEDTLARANAWLNASQASGVPIVFTNIQTESLLTKISGETASATVSTSSLSDLPNLASASLYGFEDYHGVDIGVVRSVRLWYTPIAGEYRIEIDINEADTKLGFSISRTEEGFIYIASVVERDEDAPSARSGLCDLYRDAIGASKLLIVSRINNQKVLPWIVSPSGAIRCFDTVSLSQKLSLHRHAKVPILLHVFMWDHVLASLSRGSTRQSRRPAPTLMPLPPQFQLPPHPNVNEVPPSPPELGGDVRVSSNGPELRPEIDTAGEESFRFHNFSLPDSWL